MPVGQAEGGAAGEMPCLQRARARTSAAPAWGFLSSVPKPVFALAQDLQETGLRAPCHRQHGCVFGKSRSPSGHFKCKEWRTRTAWRKQTQKHLLKASWGREWEEQGERGVRSGRERQAGR